MRMPLKWHSHLLSMCYGIKEYYKNTISVCFYYPVV